MARITPAPAGNFASRLLDWWKVHGRHELPWQQDRSLYRVWISEIMLQQTQVGTVVSYFNRFMARFPDLPALANASQDDVLALWSGLGYYARARNLYSAAQVCMKEHDGILPESADALQQLPGIGESTANAIIAQALDRRSPILDGNVKRVLARHAAIEGWPGKSAVLKQLWQEADVRTPPDRAADYTQAIMDLGATLCTPRNPACMLCPVNADCAARSQGRVDQLPGKKPKQVRPRRSSTWLVVRDESGRILLERRPPSGIWGGLWCLPQANETDEVETSGDLPAAMDHEFTHFSLHMLFARPVAASTETLVSDSQTRWFRPADALAAGIPRPIRKVIEQLTDTIPASIQPRVQT